MDEQIMSQIIRILTPTPFYSNCSTCTSYIGLLTRATVHRATSSYGEAETGPDDGSHRDIAVRNALVQVPSHRLLAVVEDSCTYLLESLKDITDASLAAGKCVHEGLVFSYELGLL